MIRLDSLTKVFDTPKGAVVAADHIDMEVPEGKSVSSWGHRAAAKPPR